MKQPLSILIALSASLLLSACVSTNKQALDAKSSSRIQGQSVASTEREKPSFAAMTPGKAMFGLIGAALMVSEGNSLIQQNNVVDPASEIAADIVSALSSSRGAVSGVKPIFVKTEDTVQLANAANSKAKVLVDVQTVNWSIAYYPTGWGSYRVIYSAKARIIDVDKKELLAENFCSKIQDDKANAPSYDALIANQAVLLKSTINQYAKECSQQFISEMLAN